jgi:hypothetical protein
VQDLHVGRGDRAPADGVEERVEPPRRIEGQPLVVRRLKAHPVCPRAWSGFTRTQSVMQRAKVWHTISEDPEGAALLALAGIILETVCEVGDPSR